MSEARNDRNTVQFGPSRTPQSYQLDRLEENVKDLERETVQSINNTTQEITNYVDQSIVNITGNAELLIGEVLTYVSATNSGTVDIDGATVNFLNASSVRLETGDTIILSANEDYPDPFAVGLVSRNGGPVGYDTYEFVSPGVVPGLPRYNVEPFGPSTSSTSLSAGSPQTYRTLGDTVTTYDGIADQIVIEDWGTPNRTQIAIPGPLMATTSGNDDVRVAINGPVTVVTKNSSPFTADGCLAINDGTNWYVYDDWSVGGLCPLPDNNNVYAAFAQRWDGANWIGGTYLLEIDQTGLITEYDLTASMGWAVYDPAVIVGGGHVVVTSLGENKLYVDGTVYSYNFSGPGKLPGGEDINNQASIFGDNLYFAWREGANLYLSNPTASPPPLGVGVMDLTSSTLDTTVYSEVVSTSGNILLDGEPFNTNSVVVVGGTHLAIGGSVTYKYLDPGGDYSATLPPYRPCVWLFDLTTHTTTAHVTQDSKVLTGYPTVVVDPNAVFTVSGYAHVSSDPDLSELVIVNHELSYSTSLSLFPVDTWIEGLSV